MVEPTQQHRMLQAVVILLKNYESKYSNSTPPE
jgi:hypothetical protein